jgi:hypothetical protein
MLTSRPPTNSLRYTLGIDFKLEEKLFMRRYMLTLLAALVISCSLPLTVAAQEGAVLLTGAELARVVPPGFYFQGLSAPTQTRNSAAARFGLSRRVIAGLVDTSGYAADVRSKYEGFLITDSEISINGKTLATGAYGFGFSNDGKLNVMDVGGGEILSVRTTRDKALKRPRPLMMTEDTHGARLYSGRDYVVISAN